MSTATLEKEEIVTKEKKKTTHAVCNYGVEGLHPCLCGFMVFTTDKVTRGGPVNCQVCIDLMKDPKICTACGKPINTHYWHLS